MRPGGSGGGERRCDGSHDSSAVAMENPVPSFGRMSAHVEQQSNPGNENLTPSTNLGGRVHSTKAFLSAAAGGFVGRTLADLALKAAHKLLPWLMG